MGVFLKVQPTTLTESIKRLLGGELKGVTVYEDEFTVEFKSVVALEVNE